MIRSVLSLRAAAGHSGALEAFYERHGILARAGKLDGCRGAVLLRATDDGPVTHLVIADWDAAAAYRRWVDDPWRAAMSLELAELLDTTPGEPVVGGLFEFVPELSPHPSVHPSNPEEQL